MRRSLRKGQNCITVVHDLNANQLLFACEVRDHQTVVDFADDVSAHGGDPEQIKDVYQDMYAACAKGVGVDLPGLLAHDGLHLVAQAFAAARGHQHQRVVALHHVANDGLLRTTELLLTKYVLQDGVCGGQREYSLFDSCQRTPDKRWRPM